MYVYGAAIAIIEEWDVEYNDQVYHISEIRCEHKVPIYWSPDQLNTESSAQRKSDTLAYVYAMHQKKLEPV